MSGDTVQNDWRPSATLETLRQRAELLHRIREFFSSRGVLEVETPILSMAATSDPSLESFSLLSPNRYLHTSPELAMKRLLAAGSGPIYQLCKVFRRDESGRHHNPEFTLLEWYRPGWSYRELMAEVEALIHALSSTPLPPIQRLSYREALLTHAGVDPFSCTTESLLQRLERGGINLHQPRSYTLRQLLDLVMAELVETQLTHAPPLFIYDYPAEQAALAKIKPDAPHLAERFELFIQGVELANGFSELVDGAEQEQRFRTELQQREEAGLSRPPIDRRFLAALHHGMEACAGVALGVDRLLMLLLGKERIAEVISFDFERA
ncbi:MAG: EF-P lysine aminoacylase GenX [Gammaproteobacteria bacterium]|nr:EF-P lysine aminoacylase GenX [Gammaproteobacteria bacterium]